MRPFVLLLCIAPLLASAEGDRLSLLAAPAGSVRVEAESAELEVDATLQRPADRILIGGRLSFTGLITYESPLVRRAWVVFPDRVAALKPNLIQFDGMKAAQFNAEYRGVYPAGTRFQLVAEVEFTGGLRMLIRAADVCLDVSFLDEFKPELGDKECW